MKSISKLDGWIYFVLFIGTIFLANYLISHVGVQFGPNEPHLIPVGFGLMAPSGVLAVGIGFTLRDLVQKRLGVKFSAIAVVIGAGVSAFLSPALALASGVAFLLSEGLDLMVYTPLRKKNLYMAVIGSNIVGLIVDSIVFLVIAFGASGLDFLWGQVVGKLYMTIAFLPIIALIDYLDKKKELKVQGYIHG